MSEPKVPKFLELEGPAIKTWTNKTGRDCTVSYTQGHDGVFIRSGYVKAKELRQLADLIDSCRPDESE